MNGISKKLLGVAGAAAALALLVGVPGASAGTTGPNFCLNSSGTNCQIQLDIPNAAISPYPAPYVAGNVTVVDSDTLQFSFHSLTGTIGADTFRYFFDNVALDLVPLATFTGSFVSGHFFNGTAATTADIHFAADLDEGSFGHNFGVVSESAGGNQGYSSSLADLTFDVSWSSGTNWSNLLTQQFMDLSEHGSDCQGAGCSAAGHVYVANVTNGVPDTAVQTGFAGWPNACDQGVGTNCVVINPNCTDGTCAVPEPASLALLGSAMVAIGIVRRRRRQTLV